MSAFQSLLVPVDFGDASARAVSVAGRLAGLSHGTIHALHAEPLDAPAYFTHDQLAGLAAQRRQLRETAEAHLATFVKRHTPAPFTTEISPDSPVDAIRQKAASTDLIVMGTHGRKGPSRWWMGSVTERVLWETDRPLLVVHERVEAARLFSRITVYTVPGVTGDLARQAGEQVAQLFAVPLIDRRRQVTSLDDVSESTLAVVAVPLPHDRGWQAAIGERLVRDAHGVMFVPERAASPRAEARSR